MTDTLALHGKPPPAICCFVMPQVFPLASLNDFLDGGASTPFS